MFGFGNKNGMPKPKAETITYDPESDRRAKEDAKKIAALPADAQQLWQSITSPGITARTANELIEQYRSSHPENESLPAEGGYDAVSKDMPDGRTVRVKILQNGRIDFGGSF